jgi:DNA helicase II / ATP-dependent DNA helicase PcrA
MKEVLKDWMQGQQQNMDQIIKDAAKDYYLKNHNFPNFIHDNNRSIKEALNLSSGNDLYYDRPSTGFIYSLWYQGRRINMLLQYLLDLLYENKDRTKLEVFDLGAGTGAVQLCFGLILKAFEVHQISAPAVKLVNIDTSAIMLEYSAEYLWPAFVNKFGEINSLLPSYSVNSWVNSDDLQISTPWIIASYLFDSSDDGETLLQDFKNLMKAIHAEKILLVSSNQPAKKAFLDMVSAGLKELDFTVENVIKDPFFSGLMYETKSVRDWIKEKARIEFVGDPSWNDYSFYGKILTSRNLKMSLVFETSAQPTDHIRIYTPPIVIRRNVKLSDEQKKAAIHDNRPTVITGPAGCGKSIVITERVLNIVKTAKEDPSVPKFQSVHKLRILITTFNKDLKYYLKNWLEELFIREEIKFTTSNRFDTGFKLEGSSIENITFMHFDVIPTRVWKEVEVESSPFLNDELKYESFHHNSINRSIQVIKQTHNITRNEYDNVLNPIYVFDEYHRIIFGQQLYDKNDYLNGTRQGRPRLSLNGKRRELLWDVIMHYLKSIDASNISSIFTRRSKFLKKIKDDARFRNIFSHVFVDEFQDCTRADYDIFYGLLKESNNLVIAGDYAQAIHIGASVLRPRSDNSEDERQGNWNTIRLKGSYRLPSNISKAIKPISEILKDSSHKDVDIITPYKGSPPGIRPIFVYGKTIEGIAYKIVNITERYANYGIFDDNQKITILEKDNDLFVALNKNKNNIAETDTILKLKGLEKNIILWSTRKAIYDEEEICNFIYTIMTRTSCMLIIALFDNINEEYVNILNLLDRNLCIYWDEDTNEFIEEKFNKKTEDEISKF